MSKRVVIKVSLPVSFFREEEYFVAYTPVLDLSTYAKSFKEAKKRFEELIPAFFEELLKKGTLEEVLAELGWNKANDGWMPPVLVSQESEVFEIPISS